MIKKTIPDFLKGSTYTVSNPGNVISLENVWFLQFLFGVSEIKFSNLGLCRIKSCKMVTEIIYGIYGGGFRNVKVPCYSCNGFSFTGFTMNFIMLWNLSVVCREGVFDQNDRG